MLADGFLIVKTFIGCSELCKVQIIFGNILKLGTKPKITSILLSYDYYDSDNFLGCNDREGHLNYIANPRRG